MNKENYINYLTINGLFDLLYYLKKKNSLLKYKNNK